MTFMRGSALAALLALGGLSACGGGGSDSAPAAAPITQADVKDVAKVGVSSTVIVKDRLSHDLLYMGGFLEGLALDTGGAGTRVMLTFACAAGGSQVATITKQAAHTGLLSGDVVSLTFDKCGMTGPQMVLDGTAKLTVRSTVNRFSLTNFTLSYEADLTSLSTTIKGTATTYSGTLAVQATLTAATDASTVRASVPQGPGFQTIVALSTGPLRFGLMPGASFDVTEFATAKRSSIKLDGDIGVVFRGDSATFTVATPTPISGAMSSNQIDLNATEGVVNTTWGSPKLATSVTLGPANAKVSGDIDGDGTMETTVDSSWTELL